MDQMRSSSRIVMVPKATQKCNWEASHLSGRHADAYGRLGLQVEGKVSCLLLDRR